MCIVVIICGGYFCNVLIRFSTFLFLLFGLNLYAQQSTIEYSAYSDKAAINEIHKEISDSIFNFVKNELTFIDFEDCNNCDSRAHLISAIIEKKFSVSASKVWLFADYKRASQAEKYKYRPDNYLTYGEDCTKWSYHVAPILAIKHDDIIDTIVIDPSTRDAPVSLKNWAINLIKPNEKGYLVIKNKIYYSFPDDEKGKFEDTKELWADDENKQLFDFDCSTSIDRILTAKYGFWDQWNYRFWQNELRDMLK